MLRAWFLFSFFIFLSCSHTKTSNKFLPNQIKNDISTTLKYKAFEWVEDFEKNKSKFHKDTLELQGFSSEGGEVILYKNPQKIYLVWDFKIYNETGQWNYIYWTDKNNRFIFVKQAEYRYNKAIYEADYQIDSIINYLEFLPERIKLYDANKKEITDPKLIEQKKEEIEYFFNELTKGLTKK